MPVRDASGMEISVALRKGTSGDGVAGEIKANLEKSFNKLDVIYPDIRIRFIDDIQRDPNAMGKVKLVPSNVRRKR
jgi:hypothetical protein